MKVTYLGHSGFLVETKQAYYLFDYIRGDLAQWNVQKPLYVFCSHSHEDHFDKKIFAPEIAEYAAAYLLSDDIRKKFQKSRPQWIETYGERIYWVKPEENVILPECRVEPLKSTDLGVAFVVAESETAFYHAGDLNWWYWESEDKAWNRNMEVNYKREIDRLKGKKMELAFVPLDPRLKEAYSYGMGYFLETTDTKTVFPMHFWGDYTVIDRYLKEYGDSERVMKLEREGQEYEI
jgi:hypothetical protein